MKAVLALMGGAVLLFGGWYLASPHWAVDALAESREPPEEIAARYDRLRVRAAFEEQMLPQTADYPPPFTKDVVLDALSDPRAVQSLVQEPCGMWQFAAAAGLPDELKAGEVQSMPRLLETGDGWTIGRQGFDVFHASDKGCARGQSNTYQFERDGLGWQLVAIELTVPIR